MSHCQIHSQVLQGTSSLQDAHVAYVPGRRGLQILQSKDRADHRAGTVRSGTGW